MRPEGGVWLDAFELAYDKAASAEPHDAIRDTLLALRATGGASARSPELWTFSPTSVTTVDAAGYVHEQSGDVPDVLVTMASGETEGTLRVEVLAALEVRRPEVRPLYNWMSARSAAFATVVGCAGETEGVLVMPRAGRVAPVTLEEVQSLRRVADRLAVACRSRGTQARMLSRANEAVERATKAEARSEALLRERALDLTRNALAAARLARPATVGIYSAASRMALEALERRTAAGSPLALVVPSGGDPIPYLARAHLAGARAGGPLVLVDGTSAREHDAARWADAASSPLALAEGGMLVLLDGAALPGPVQQLLARACAERRAPWDGDAPLDVLLALTGIAAPSDLVAEGRLDAALAARLGDAQGAPIVLPRLRDRIEDVRAILTDSLARQGMRVLGRPVGIDHAAYARLVEHEFPGEDAELAAIVERLVSRCAEDRGRDVVRAADLDTGLGLQGRP
jgi:transcriptional regulator of acetoin/glycerol metabolism